MTEFTIYQRAPRGQAKGKRVRAQWLDDRRYDNDGKMFVRSRLFATELVCDVRAGRFAGMPCLACVRLVL